MTLHLVAGIFLYLHLSAHHIGVATAYPVHYFILHRNNKYIGMHLRYHTIVLFYSVATTIDL